MWEVIVEWLKLFFWQCNLSNRDKVLCTYEVIWDWDSCSQMHNKGPSFQVMWEKITNIPLASHSNHWKTTKRSLLEGDGCIKSNISVVQHNNYSRICFKHEFRVFGWPLEKCMVRLMYACNFNVYPLYIKRHSSGEIVPTGQFSASL